MSCFYEEGSLFTLDTQFAGYTCPKNFNALISVIVFNSFMVLLSIFISTRRYQEERRFLNIDRDSPEWSNHFWRFLALVGISNIITVINFLLLVQSNILQIVVVVLVRIFGYFAIHQLNLVKNDFTNYRKVNLVEE